MDDPFKKKGCYPLLRTRGYPLVLMNMKGWITHVVIGQTNTTTCINYN